MHLTAELDIRTLLFLVTLVGLLMALTMAVFARRFPHYPGAGWVAAADACIALGAYLIAMRGEFPDWLTTLPASALTLLGLLLNYEGLRRLLQERNAWFWSPHWLLLLLLPGSWYYTYVDPSVHGRVVVFSGVGCLAALLTTYMVLVPQRAADAPNLRPVAWVFAGFALMLLLRVFHTQDPRQVDDFMYAGALNAAVLASYIVFLILKDVGLLQACVRQLIADVERQARTDPLTRLMNRRAVMEQGERAFHRAVSGQAPMAAIMVDLDHFKRVNDEHGHQTGDAVLQGVARILQGSVRPGDLCARFGGEEFLLVLPETALAEAEQLAERLRLKVEQSSPEHCGGIACTASFGVAALADETRLEELISRADQAMYEAKHAGRNRVEVSQVDMRSSSSAASGSAGAAAAQRLGAE
ncbi:GGDEF domain-containing protein [Pseudomarimonas arenosa]|uniref:diguanylate cyclase n=1 Tax=Pseudomarimonas arenosa TaxID=2774145 RepID=A0AAW3ZQ73_9GAMM|nr:GGDEF domain-containing protein [Pseudomarimonas arenosa]MBD8527252.1 GGDEF domain-containing protein [Pseudomarimonas arenosa]